MTPDSVIRLTSNATVKGLFVQPAQGRALVDALEHNGSYHYCDPAHAHSRGFHAEGHDFLQRDRDGHGRNFVDGRWSAFSRDELWAAPVAACAR